MLSVVRRRRRGEVRLDVRGLRRTWEWGEGLVVLLWVWEDGVLRRRWRKELKGEWKGNSNGERKREGKGLKGVGCANSDGGSEVEVGRGRFSPQRDA